MQYTGLKFSAALYDAGHRTEAVRIANALFILLGPHSRNHHSIVDQLDPHGARLVPSTAGHQGGSSLIAVEATPYVRSSGPDGYFIECTPFGRESLTSAPFLSIQSWWDEKILSGAGALDSLTRLQVVKIARDQDGGAHLDPSINNASYVAAYLKGVGYMYKPSDESEHSLPVDGAIEATIRQMAYEAIPALRSYAIAAQIDIADAANSGPLIPQYFEGY